MFSLEFEAADDEKDLLIAELWELGCEGVVEEGAVLRAFFAEKREEVLERFRERRPKVVEHPARDWVAHAQSLLAPIEVGEKFFLVPEWRDDPAPEGRLRIAINPGLACGTGAHEATRLCLGAMERYLQPGMTFVDVGTGSGILSVAAALAGAGRVIACDDDPEAAPIAADNFRRAGVRVDLFAGSLAALGRVRAGLVVANISAPASIQLVREMLRVGDTCVASGFEGHEEETVRTAIEQGGGAVREIRAENAWRAIVYTRAIGGAGNAPRSSSSLTATSRISSSS